MFFLLLVWTAGLFSYVQYIESLDIKGRAAIHHAPNQSIIVLTGGDQRIATGLELLQAGVAPQMFISGVGDGVRLQDILPRVSEDQAQQIFLGREAHDTLGNAEEVAAWLENHKDIRTPTRMVLVSAHYHLPRALWHFSQKMPEITWIPIAAHPEALSLARWYQSPLGWRLLSSELAKFLSSQLIQAINI